MQPQTLRLPSYQFENISWWRTELGSARAFQVCSLSYTVEQKHLNILIHCIVQEMHHINAARHDV